MSNIKSVYYHLKLNTALPAVAAADWWGWHVGTFSCFDKFDRAFELVFIFLMDKKETGVAGLMYKEFLGVVTVWWEIQTFENKDHWDQVASFLSSFPWDSIAYFHFCSIISYSSIRTVCTQAAVSGDMDRATSLYCGVFWLLEKPYFCEREAKASLVVCGCGNMAALDSYSLYFNNEPAAGNQGCHSEATVSWLGLLATGSIHLGFYCKHVLGTSTCIIDKIKIALPELWQAALKWLLPWDLVCWGSMMSLENICISEMSCWQHYCVAWQFSSSLWWSNWAHLSEGLCSGLFGLWFQGLWQVQ